VDLITERDGYTHEFFMYNPWGEEMHQWNANTYAFTSPYRFNAKELDPETGLAYYGARYYQNKLGVWLSVDPLALVGHNVAKTPSHFTSNNPIMRIDPNGMNDVCPTCPGGSEYDMFRELPGEYEYDAQTNEVTRVGEELNEVTVKAPPVTPLDDFAKQVNASMNNNLREGVLNREDFINNYRFGRGQAATVPLGIVNLKGLTVKDFEDSEIFYPFDAAPGEETFKALQVNFDQSFYKDVDHAFIFGTITLIQIEGNLIMAIPDTYNFDFKNDPTFKGLLRNMGTIGGQMYNGVGKSFPIYFQGAVRIPKR
jgi:RHS repeat-associated protein